jgi:hypothetical protein
MEDYAIDSQTGAAINALRCCTHDDVSYPVHGLSFEIRVGLTLSIGHGLI